MANSDKNIRITPNKNTTSYPKIVFTGQTNAPITLNVLDDNSLSFEGTSGQLFSISNNISSGTIFSVSDISGIPSLRINADGTVGIAEFSGNVGIGLTNPQYKLHVNGTFGVTGAFALLSNTQSTSSTTGALTVVGGLGVSGNVRIGTGLGVSGATILGSTLAVTGAATLSSTLAVTGVTYLSSDLGVGGSTNITGGLGVTGAVTLRSTVDISGATTITLSSASAKGLVIKGAVSQSANLLEFQNSSSAILASIDPSGIFTLANNTATTSSTSGALIVSGGVGVSGSVNIGTNLTVAGTTTLASLTISSNTQSTSSTTGALVLTGGLGVSGNVNVGTGLTVSGTVGIVGREIITNTTTSTSYNTGALVVSGGVGISGPLYATKAGFGTENTSAGLHIVSPSTSTNSLVISKRTSQTSNTFLINDANGNPLISTSYTAGSGETGNGVLNIHANRDIGDAGSDIVFSIRNGSSNVGGFSRSGTLYFTANIYATNGSGSNELIFSNVYGNRLGIYRPIWHHGDSIYFPTSAMSIAAASTYRQNFSGAGSTTAINWAFFAGPWNENARVLGIVTPGGGDRSYFGGYGNLVINLANWNSSNGWDATNLLSVNIDQYIAFTGNLAQFSVSGTNRFVIGPSGDTQILLSSASAKGLIVKGAA